MKNILLVKFERQLAPLPVPEADTVLFVYGLERTEDLFDVSNYYRRTFEPVGVEFGNGFIIISKLNGVNVNCNITVTERSLDEAIKFYM